MQRATQLFNLPSITYSSNLTVPSVSSLTGGRNFSNKILTAPSRPCREAAISGVHLTPSQQTSYETNISLLLCDFQL